MPGARDDGFGSASGHRASGGKGCVIARSPQGERGDPEPQARLTFPLDRHALAMLRLAMTGLDPRQVIAQGSATAPTRYSAARCGTAHRPPPRSERRPARSIDKIRICHIVFFLAEFVHARTKIRRESSARGQNAPPLHETIIAGGGRGMQAPLAPHGRSRQLFAVRPVRTDWTTPSPVRGAWRARKSSRADPPAATRRASCARRRIFLLFRTTTL